VPHWLEILVFILVQLFMLVGLFGMIVPIFPGPIIMWLAILGYGIATRFDSTLGIVLFVIITLLMIFASLIDNILMGAGARKGGAAWVTILVALAAGIAGTILLPPFGGIIAAPLSIFLLEWLRLKDAKKALRAFTGLTAGWGLSFAVRFGVGLVMMSLWWLWVWKG
jgi:uncharacterized protein YqgC (DUF456 family)